MSPRKADAAFLADMLEYARDLVEAVRGHNLKSYLADANPRFAVERRIEIIGEAARRVSESFQSEHPEIPWRSDSGMHWPTATRKSIRSESGWWRPFMRPS